MDKTNMLVDRYSLGEVDRPKVWFKFGKWSVVNFGELISTHPCPTGCFMGWEAYDGEAILRTENLSDMLKLLELQPRVFTSNDKIPHSINYPKITIKNNNE